MKEIDELLGIMQCLRDPKSGCPWDRQQTIASILPFTLEEVYELVDAIDRGDVEDVREELGDLLFHIAFYAQMANEAGHFDFRSVTEKLNKKLRRRHPHVFADTTGTAEEQTIAWEHIKEQERRERGVADAAETGLLAGISRALPAVLRAHKLQTRAAGVGFDWEDTEAVLDKVEEELNELRQEINSGISSERIMDELGDLMFACVNFARHARIDPELALRGANRKFEHRFRYMEAQLARQNRTLTEASLAQMEVLWREAKAVPDEA
ncbi:MAG: nucleoside triphosphate pyrophosphohydrolase [Gammaproteobacteria bacterium]